MGSRKPYQQHDLIPLASLISREMKNEIMEKPIVKYGHARQSKKGEDYIFVKNDCQRVPGNASSTFSVFAGGAVSDLTVDHRLEDNVEERQRVTASGGEVGRLSIVGGVEIGPLRCWPGGLCLSRSIGDVDVGEFIVPIPYVKQVKLSSFGGRLIIASDGIWDAISSEMAAKACRGLPAELAARQVVKEALRTRGLKDDTTCIVVDIIPPENPAPPLPLPKKQNRLKALFFWKKNRDSSSKLSKKLSAISIVEELFEDGSAMLADRLGNNESCSQSTSGLFTCAICQVDLAPSEGISVHAGSIFSTSSKPWQGPFLCADCRNKKDAMEGKRPSGLKVV